MNDSTKQKEGAPSFVPPGFLNSAPCHRGRQASFKVGNAAKQDLFAEAKGKITIFDAWEMLGLNGEPKATCKSPFREDKSPSFSIHSEGKAFKDHATGDGGDVIEFIRLAIGGNHQDVREWLRERMGANYAPTTTHSAPKTRPAIQWPSDQSEGTGSTWKAFAKLRGYSCPAVYAMVKSGTLSFCKIGSDKCFIVTDPTHRAAEIRRIDGGLFFNGRKAYPLSGVDKSWLIGANWIKGEPKQTSVLFTEGATDLLAAFDLYSRYRREGGNESWLPITLLGAGCKTLCPEITATIKGRYVRIVPDADPAGDQMADHWQALLRKIGCTVDIVNLPTGTDLSDHLHTIKPTDLYSQ